MRHQGEDVFPYISGEELQTVRDADSSPSRCNPSTSSRLSASSVTNRNDWLPKFKLWLPAYLDGVYKRLKDGEVYPLSALKGDFRANCGLDMDHSSLGYSKLSEFIKSMPELCRMKIATVGNGPATHSVILPAAAHRRTVAANQPQQSSVTSPLVRRIYGPHLKGPISPIKRPGIITTTDSVSTSQNIYRDDVAYVYCVFCSTWHSGTYWMGIPYSRFGICSFCKDDACAHDKLKRHRIKTPQHQHQPSLQLHQEKVSLASEETVVDRLALMSEKLVADKLPIISKELEPVVDNFRLFPREILCSHTHRLS